MMGIRIHRLREGGIIKRLLRIRCSSCRSSWHRIPFRLREIIEGEGRCRFGSLWSGPHGWRTTIRNGCKCTCCMDQGIKPRGLRGLKGIGMNDWRKFGEINSNRMNLFMSIESVGRGVGFDRLFEGCCRDKSLWNEIGKRRIRDDLLRDIVVRDSTLANELIDLVHPNEFNHKGACKKHLHWTVLIVWCGLSSFGSLWIVSDTLLRILGFVYHRFVRVENRSMMAMWMIGFVSPNCFSFLCLHPHTFYWCIE